MNNTIRLLTVLGGLGTWSSNARSEFATGTIYGTTDSCSSYFAITSVNENTDCNALSNTQSSWSVKAGGVCRDIDDTNVRHACFDLKGQIGGATLYGTSDSCAAGSAIASVSYYSNCESYSDNGPVWSLKVNGQCHDIADTTPRRACREAQGGLGALVIYGTSDSCNPDDSIAAVTWQTECDSLLDSGSAWSIKVNGVCKDIQDTTPRRACASAQGDQPGVAVIYGTSDSCEENSSVVAINLYTKCETLSTQQSAWSIKVNGQCKDIQDTNVKNACYEAQGNLPGGSTIYGTSDSCSASQAIASVNPNTDCSMLSTQQSAWSIKVGGMCQDISDTNVRGACFEAQGQ